MHTLLTNITSHHTGYQLFFKAIDVDASYEVIHSIDHEVAVTYTMAVKFIKQQKKDYIIRLIKSNLEAPGAIQNQALELAVKCGDVLYPLDLVVNTNGNIIDVYDHAAIVNRWLKAAAALHYEYEGNAFAQYIYHTELNLSDKDNMLKWLQADLFLSVYFTSVNASLRDRLSIQFKSQYALPAITEMVTEQLPEMLDDYFYKLNVTGASMSEASEITTLTGHYIISRKEFTIHSAEFTWQKEQHGQTSLMQIQIKKHNIALQ